MYAVGLMYITARSFGVACGRDCLLTMAAVSWQPVGLAGVLV